MQLANIYKVKNTRQVKNKREFLKYTLLMGLLLAAGIALIKTFEFYYFTYIISSEIYIGFISIVFLALGIYLGIKFAKKRANHILAIEPVNLPMEMELSKREMEVLQQLSSGLSNQEIADKLFISLNTIKTHTNNIYSKLNVKRRSQAIDTARKLKLIP